MTNQEKWYFLELLVKYLETEPLSHRKRDLLHQIVREIIESIKPIVASAPAKDDIPF